MKLVVLSIFLSLFSFLGANTSKYSTDVATLAKQFNLYAGARASVQWERIFASKRHLKRYKLDTLDADVREKLKRYLISHSADSDQPIVPGL